MAPLMCSSPPPRRGSVFRLFRRSSVLLSIRRRVRLFTCRLKLPLLQNRQIHLTHPSISVGIVSLVSVGDTSLASKRLLPAGLSQRFSNLCFTDVLISLVWYLGFSHGSCMYLALVRPPTAVCSPFTVLCSYTFVVFKSFCVQLWQLDGLMFYISIHPVDRVLSDVYYPSSFIMELVFLTVSSTTLCGFGAGSSMLEIRDTLNTEVLIKGGLAMLRIVNCALDVVSISGCISLFVVVNSQGFVSLFSLMVVEFRGLLYVIGCLSVVFAPIFIYCICFLVIIVSLAMMAMLSCFCEHFLHSWRVRFYKIEVCPKKKGKV
ncbi:BnaC02g20300D [Brassica napus]|uniref:BnaC02g20300D protein n=3 Tax=Brassica TaxID=3705 RepID=A0A078FBZ6_BRANA|nr:BnaC02g20300D [Brassica napus]VDD22698.1 unnamed protein product [Brassica oleracea]